jgi:hypothetical protein
VTHGNGNELEQRWWHAAYPVSGKATAASGPSQSGRWPLRRHAETAC